MNLISCEELKNKIDQKDKFKLVNAMDKISFNAMHIPGSINIPKPEDIEIVLNSDDEIVVYCTNVACQKSVTLYLILSEKGYKNIQHFAGGLEAWVSLGYDLAKGKRSNS